jgi:predicted DNA-binding transcriptional regulator YafY
MPISKLEELTWQLEMLQLLPNKAPGMSYEEIHQALVELGYGKSLRTVQRTLPSLAPLGLERDVVGKVHRWYWPTRYFRPERHLMPTAEAVSLRLIDQLVTPLLPNSLRQALDSHFKEASIRLDALRRLNQRVDWPEKVAAIPSHLTLRPPQIEPEILGTVQEALLEDKELDVEYQSLKDPAPNRRRLHPRALIQAGPVTYLVATRPDSEKDPEKALQYRLDRIHKAIITGRRTSRSNFNLKAYLDNEEDKVGTREVIRLELWVSPRLASILKDTALSDDQQLRFADDGAIVKASVRNTLRLQQWLLGHREHVEVIKPVVLRSWMAQKLEAALARYR